MAMRAHRRTRRTNQRHLRHVSHSPLGEEVRFTRYKNPFTQDGEFVSDEHEQDWDLPIPLLESPPHDDDFLNSPSITSYYSGHYIDTRPVDNYRTAGEKRIPFCNTPRLTLSAQQRADSHNTWYLDSCCGQHMVGSKRFISNARPIPDPTIITVVNNQQLAACACGIDVLKAHNSDNDILIVRDLRYNLLSYEQLVNSGVLMTTDPVTRPDLSYISSQLAQYAKRLEGEHMLDLQRALQYFISTPHIGFTYSTLTTPSSSLVGYVDADHAADPANRRSRTGFLFRLEPTGQISKNSQKQEMVALSSTEAEFIAATSAVRKGLYL
ncbi:unnamed protein product [Closterium sp. NIES-53]